MLETSSSGYYDWLNRPVSKRAEEDSQLTEQIIKFHGGSGCSYGSPRIYKDLEAAGVKTARKRVERLMKAAAIKGKSKRKYKTSRQSKHQRPLPELRICSSKISKSNNRIKPGSVISLILRL